MTSFILPILLFSLPLQTLWSSEHPRSPKKQQPKVLVRRTKFVPYQLGQKMVNSTGIKHRCEEGNFPLKKELWTTFEEGGEQEREEKINQGLPRSQNVGKVLGVLLPLLFPLPPSVEQTNDISSLFSPFSYFLSASPAVRETEGSRVSIFEALPCNLRLRWVSLSPSLKSLLVTKKKSSER